MGARGAAAYQGVAPRAFSLTKVMRDKHAVWEGLVRGHGLAPHSLQALAIDSVEETVKRMNYPRALELLPA